MKYFQVFKDLIYFCRIRLQKQKKKAIEILKKTDAVKTLYSFNIDFMQPIRLL